MHVHTHKGKIWMMKERVGKSLPWFDGDNLKDQSLSLVRSEKQWLGEKKKHGMKEPNIYWESGAEGLKSEEHVKESLS